MIIIHEILDMVKLVNNEYQQKLKSETDENNDSMSFI